MQLPVPAREITPGMENQYNIGFGFGFGYCSFWFWFRFWLFKNFSAFYWFWFCFCSNIPKKYVKKPVSTEFFHIFT